MTASSRQSGNSWLALNDSPGSTVYSMKFPARGLLFDLDGTLVDSVPDITAAINHTLSTVGLPLQPQQKIRQWVGNGAPRLLKRAMAGSVDGEPDSQLFAEALPLFYDYYAAHNNDHTVVYDGVTDTLKVFKQRGFTMACVTNKPARHTAPLLRATGLAGFFHSVVAGDTLQVQKPDPAPMRLAASELNLDTGQCLMVGDSLSDIRAAKAANMAMLCMTYGYNQGADLTGSGADYLVNRFCDLTGLIEMA